MHFLYKMLNEVGIYVVFAVTWETKTKNLDGEFCVIFLDIIVHNI